MERSSTLSKRKDIGRSFSILLAESNIFLGQKIEEILSRDEAVLWVFHVTGRAQLLREAANLHPDLILGDIKLLKDKKIVDTLRQTASFARIVALTGSEAEPYMVLTRSLGLDGMLEKGRIEINVLKGFIQSQGEGDLT